MRDDLIDLLQDCIDDSEKLLKKKKGYTKTALVNMSLELFKARVTVSLIANQTRHFSQPQYV